MNNEKQQLLQNPLVKEIAEDFAKQFVFTEKGDKILFWDDFVKSNEPVREWEILEYLLAGDLYFKLSDKTAFINFLGFTKTEEKLISSGAKIQKVKRLSDGEIFVVGDNIYFSEITGKISAFEVQEEKLLIHVIRPCGGIVKNIYITKAQKSKEPFLFVTKDGHFIFNGDEYWAIYSGWAIGRFTATNNDTDFQNKITSFSTEQAAKDFVLASKPCLSVNDVLSFTFSESVHVKRLQEHLLELAKSKQNNR